MKSGPLATSIALAALVCLGLAPAADAAFSPAKNGRIAFERWTYVGGDPDFESSFDANIWSMEADGSNPVNLTPGTPSTDERQPAYSPNGRKIAFAVSTEGALPFPFYPSDIAVINADGSGRFGLTDYGDAEDPGWSPDGKMLITRGRGTLTLVDANSGGLTPVQTANSVAVRGNLDYAPDGTQFAYGYTYAFTSRVGVIATDRSYELLDVTSTPEGTSHNGPSVSPDGTRLAFARSTEVGPSGRETPPDVMVQNADRSITNLTPGFDPLAMQPSFSPDGTSVAFVSLDARFAGSIHVVEATGGAPRALTAPGSRDWNPAWQYIFTCKGRRATIVGDSGPDAIKGTRRADVIVGNPGPDRILGRGGNDRICGGPGRDRLIGGAGRDRISGGPDRDTIVKPDRSRKATIRRVSAARMCSAAWAWWRKWTALMPSARAASMFASAKSRGSYLGGRSGSGVA